MQFYADVNALEMHTCIYMVVLHMRISKIFLCHFVTDTMKTRTVDDFCVQWKTRERTEHDLFALAIFIYRDILLDIAKADASYYISA